MCCLGLRSKVYKDTKEGFFLRFHSKRRILCFKNLEIVKERKEKIGLAIDGGM